MVKDKIEDGESFYEISCECRPFKTIVYGTPVCRSETWTEDNELNKKMTETLGYVPIEKMVERAMQAGENIVLTRLREGTYSNEEGDEEFHDNPLDDFSSMGIDDLRNLQRLTAENFYIKKAAIASLIREKTLKEQSAEKLSTGAEGAPGQQEPGSD